MDADDLRAYACRRWDLLQEEKDRRRAVRFRAAGPTATLAASFELREQWRHARLGSSEARREADFAHHLALQRLLARVSHAFDAG